MRAGLALVRLPGAGHCAGAAGCAAAGCSRTTSASASRPKRACRRRATSSPRCATRDDRRGPGVHRRRRRQPHDLPDDGGARHLDDHRDRGVLLPGQAPRVAGAVRAPSRSRSATGRPTCSATWSRSRRSTWSSRSRCGWWRRCRAMARRTVRGHRDRSATSPGRARWSPSRTWVNHLIPSCWTEPRQFDPERFDEPRREDKKHRFALHPLRRRGPQVHRACTSARSR